MCSRDARDKISRYYLVFLNVLFLLIGCALGTFGIWLRIDNDMLNSLKILKVSLRADNLHLACYIMIAVAACIIFISFFGCCGACFEKPGCLLFYAVLCLLILLSQVTIAALAFVYKDKVFNFLKKRMSYDVKHKYQRKFFDPTAEVDAFSLYWDIVQVNMRCCGGGEPKDYENSLWYNITKEHTDTHGTTEPELTRYFVPDTCCVLHNKNVEKPDPVDRVKCQKDADEYIRKLHNGVTDYLHVYNCHRRLKDWFEKNGVYILVVVCCVCAFQFFGFIAACCLISSIKRENRMYLYNSVYQGDKPI
ncbi:DgyrCDS9652 [Dimorphilus gyrociliatus]|uniref:Tetraspanin n=1 Tax=Dimorphilus gyrociliatus TaxID=2664684 RepID=A0A7I8VYW8_9ANNE|nr:DgyrCDS9652 [Dimorphilus gyrociliatus]